MTEADAAGVDSNVTYDTAQVRAPDEIAERLQIDPGTLVSRTYYQFFADGEPVQVSTQWEPISLTGGTAIEVPEEGPVGKEGVIARYDSIGIHVTHVHEVVNSRMPTPEEARLLDIPPGTPVFAITRTHWAGKVPVETAGGGSGWYSKTDRTAPFPCRLMTLGLASALATAGVVKR